MQGRLLCFVLAVAGMCLPGCGTASKPMVKQWNGAPAASIEYFFGHWQGEPWAPKNAKNTALGPVDCTRSVQRVWPAGTSIFDSTPIAAFREIRYHSTGSNCERRGIMRVVDSDLYVLVETSSCDRYFEDKAFRPALSRATENSFVLTSTEFARPFRYRRVSASRPGSE